MPETKLQRQGNPLHNLKRYSKQREVGQIDLPALAVFGVWVEVGEVRNLDRATRTATSADLDEAAFLNEYLLIAGCGHDDLHVADRWNRHFAAFEVGVRVRADSRRCEVSAKIVSAALTVEEEVIPFQGTYR